MNRGNDTIRILIPLKLRKKNGRPKIMPLRHGIVAVLDRVEILVVRNRDPARLNR